MYRDIIINNLIKRFNLKGHVGMKTVIIGIIAVVGFIVFVGGHEPVSLEDTITQNAAAHNQASALNESSSELIDQASTIDLQVPNFEAELTNGETAVLSELVEDKPTMIGFWASWCHNCRRNLPIQNEIYQRYKDQVNIIEVNLAETRSAVDSYHAQTGYDFLMAYDETGSIGAAFGTQYTNTHVLVASDGSLIEAFSGDVTEEHFQKLVQSN